MNQLNSCQDRRGGHAGTRSGITRQDLLRKAGHLANRHRPKAGAVLTPAAAYPHGRQLELAAAQPAEVITPGDLGYDEAPRSWSQRC